MTIDIIDKTMQCELVSWERYTELSHLLAEKIRHSAIEFDMIIAIARGGYMPARLISDILGVMNLTSFKIEHYRGSLKSPQAIVQFPLVADVSQKRILLVDDVSDSGDTFHVAIKHIKSVGTPKSIFTAVLHHKTVSKYVPDFYAQVVKEWRWIIYPWAVTEDLTVLINKMDPQSANIEEIKRYLFNKHSISPSMRQIHDALKLIDN